MSLVKRVANKAKSKAPRFAKAVVLARPLPLIADEKPPAGDDFYFKVVIDPTDPHLAQIESPERLEIAKSFFAMGGARLSRHPQTHGPRRLQDVAARPTRRSRRRRSTGSFRSVSPTTRDTCSTCGPTRTSGGKRLRSRWCTSWRAVAAERYPHLRWVYCYAHEDNEASLNLIKHVYGMWPVQTVTEVAIGDLYVDIVPGSDNPKFGPFSKKGRHSGDGFSVPGRPRSGPDAQRLPPQGRLGASSRTTPSICDDWWWSGPEWFDTDHPLDADGRPATPDTLRRLNAGVGPQGGASPFGRSRGTTGTLSRARSGRGSAGRGAWTMGVD